MATIRMTQQVYDAVFRHLFTRRGEHFAFLLAETTSSADEPVFLVNGTVFIPDEGISRSDIYGYSVKTEWVIKAVNAAIRTNSALIEVHNHGGHLPRFSGLDEEGLREFPVYVHESIPNKPYAATVWGDTTIHGEYFSPNGERGRIRSITVIGEQLRQVVSRDDDLKPAALSHARQLAWFTEQGQRQIARLKIGVVGAGGTGSQVIQNLAYLGVRDFVIVEHDRADETSQNRLVTGKAADTEQPKGLLAARFVREVCHDVTVAVIDDKLQSSDALDALRGVDTIFGCVDNDGARLVLNELALAYTIPYFDLGVEVDAVSGRVEGIGGRVGVILHGGPCLNCMGQIDLEEASYFLESEFERRQRRDRGYVRGLEVPAPAVISLNAMVAAIASNEFTVLVSGARSVNHLTEFDLLGSGRALKAQWVTPVRVSRRPQCLTCTLSGKGDHASLDRYTRLKLVG